MHTVTIPQPDDWHLHLRDGATMTAVLKHSAERFARAIVMPNLSPPITTTRQALEYRERILAALPPKSKFEPLMTLYLTESTTPEEIVRAKQSGFIHGVKLYPAGATTNSAAGVRNLMNCQAVLETMAEQKLPLLVHGEITDPEVDIFDREQIFLERMLAPLLEKMPHLKVVMEHITTRNAVEFINLAGPNLAATITAHHLFLNRNAILAGGIQPHHYCLPVLKRESHREALMEAATSGSPKFFLGTDSAPHPRNHKESSCGCAGIYTAHAAIELYTELFAKAGQLDRLAEFASGFGADFYGLPRNRKSVTLTEKPWIVPQQYALGKAGIVIPFRSGERISWRLTHV